MYATEGPFLLLVSGSRQQKCPFARNQTALRFSLLKDALTLLDYLKILWES